jgi:hypothetical protein
MSTMKKVSRRAIISGATAIPLASVATLASEGSALGGDSELRRLWAEYLKQADAHAAAWGKYNSVRAVFDAELPPCPDDVFPGHHWQAHEGLWHRCGLEPLWETINVTDSAMRDTIAAILHTEAEGLFGIGVKLAAMPRDRDQQDYEDAIVAVQQDIDRLLGSHFAAMTSMFALAADAADEDEDKDEDEDEEVRS